MTLPVIFYPEAEEDLAQIEEYLAGRFSPSNARTYVQRIVAACNAIALAPYRGTRRDDVRSGLRTTGFERRATIAFSVEVDHIAILGIAFAGRTIH